MSSSQEQFPASRSSTEGAKAPSESAWPNTLAYQPDAAPRFIEQGGNPQTLKVLLCHSTLAMTMDLYSQVMETTRQKEMAQMQMTI